MMIKTIIIHEIHDKTSLLDVYWVNRSFHRLTYWRPGRHFQLDLWLETSAYPFLRFLKRPDVTFVTYGISKCVKMWRHDGIDFIFWLKTAKPRYWMKKPNHVTLLMGNSVVTNTWPSSSLNLKLNWQGCLQIKCQFNFKRLRFYNGLNNITRH